MHVDSGGVTKLRTQPTLSPINDTGIVTESWEPSPYPRDWVMSPRNCHDPPGRDAACGIVDNHSNGMIQRITDIHISQSVLCDPLRPPEKGVQCSMPIDESSIRGFMASLRRRS